MSSSALAADLLEPVVPVEPVVVPEAFNWTGGYVGLNAGWAFEANWDDDDDDFGDDGRHFWHHDGDNDNDLNGPFVGAQAGFNFQTGMFVVGVEGDIQWANIDGDDDGDDDGANGGNGNNLFTGRVARLFANGRAFEACRARVNCVTDFDQQVRGGGLGFDGGNDEVDWFGTLRLRAGVALDRTLLYVTGGPAFGDGGEDGDGHFGFVGGVQRATIKQDRNVAEQLRAGLGGGRDLGLFRLNRVPLGKNNLHGRVRVIERVRFTGANNGGDGDGDANWGWSLGGGIEHAFTDNVSVKAEYQYINLDGGFFGIGGDDDDNGGVIHGVREFEIVRGGAFGARAVRDGDGARERELKLRIDRRDPAVAFGFVPVLEDRADRKDAKGRRNEFTIHTDGDDDGLDFHTLRVGVNVLF